MGGRSRGALKLYRSDAGHIENGFSRRILDIDWSSRFPLSLDREDIFVEYGSFTSGMKFIMENYPKIYPQTDSERFLREEMTESRKKYYREAGDFFLFKHSEKTIGVFVGTMIDWSSYYLRTSAILPEYRGNGRYQKLFSHLLDVLKSNGIQRAEGHIPPSNLSHIHIFNKFNFKITGFQVSERWGALIHFTNFLQEKNETTFMERFCASDFKKSKKK